VHPNGFGGIADMDDGGDAVLLSGGVPARARDDRGGDERHDRQQDHDRRSGQRSPSSRAARTRRKGGIRHQATPANADVIRRTSRLTGAVTPRCDRKVIDL
jgi:hypothetical protein